jgi:hypothetical protein
MDVAELGFWEGSCVYGNEPLGSIKFGDIS